MKLSEIRDTYRALVDDMKTWPEPTTNDERHMQLVKEFEAMPRVKYDDLPASIQKAVRNRFPVDEMRSFLSSLSKSKYQSNFDFSELIQDIPEKDLDKLLIRARNTAIYTIELDYSDSNEEEFAPVLYGNYAVSAFIDALNQYRAPHAPIQRRKSENIMIDSWARLPAAKMPTSPLTYLFARVLNAGPDGPKASRINRHEKIGIAHNAAQNATQYTRINNNHEYRVTVYDPANTLKGGGKAISKLFFFMLQCWAHSDYGREFSFPLSMLVDLGMNDSIESARIAVKNFMGRQALIQLSQTTQTGKNAKTSSGGTVFYNYQIENNTVTISVNEKMPMQLLANFFTMFPLFAYKLSTKAFYIVNYIMYLARQNGNKLSENNGVFHITLEAIRQYLELPTPAEVKNHKYYEKIRKPIESAIEEIEGNMLNDSFHFKMTPRVEDDSSITAWLNGDLEIEMPAELTAQFVAIADKAERHYKQRQRDLEQARAKIAAKAEKKNGEQANA